MKLFQNFQDIEIGHSSTFSIVQFSSESPIVQGTSIVHGTEPSEIFLIIFGLSGFFCSPDVGQKCLLRSPSCEVIRFLKGGLFYPAMELNDRG